MPDGTPYAHVWVENNKTHICIFRGIINGEVMDLSAPRAEYYKEFKVQEKTIYTVKRAFLENLISKHYGPWEEKYKALVRKKEVVSRVI